MASKQALWDFQLRDRERESVCLGWGQSNLGVNARDSSDFAHVWLRPQRLHFKWLNSPIPTFPFLFSCLSVRPSVRLNWKETEAPSLPVSFSRSVVITSECIWHHPFNCVRSNDLLKLFWALGLLLAHACLVLPNIQTLIRLCVVQINSTVQPKDAT